MNPVNQIRSLKITLFTKAYVKQIMEDNFKAATLKKASKCVPRNVNLFQP